MLHHISIAAENPAHVASVIAEIWRGQAFPFPPFPGAYIVLADDAFGTAIEIAPLGYELMPGETEVTAQAIANPSPFSSTHAAVSVPTTRTEIEAIAQREGWRVLYCNREDVFDVIELWVENRLLLELLSPEMSDRYTRFMTPKNWEQLLATAAV